MFRPRTGLLAVAFAAGAFATPVLAQDMKHVAISTIVEVPALNETKEGVLQGLAEAGFKEGETLAVDYQNANGNMPTQQQIAKKFAGEAPDVIVAITTPTAQAMAASAPDIPIVFASVTDPVKAKLVEGYEPNGGMITGVSDAAPIKQQMDLFLKLVPETKKVGFIYNPGLDNAVATLGWVREDLEARGIEVVESPSPTTNEVIPAARKLVGQVDFIYVPNDTTVVAALEAIVKVGQDTQTPIFAGETGAVGRGTIAGLGLDYIALGKIAGKMTADILNGTAPGDIAPVLAYEQLSDFKVVLNPSAAEAMGVTIPEDVMSMATDVIE